MKNHAPSEQPISPKPDDHALSQRHTSFQSSQLNDLTQLFDYAPVGLCLIDTELRYKRINDHLAKLNGLPTEAHIGKTIREVIPEVANIVEPYYRKVIDTGTPLLEVEVKGKTQANAGLALDYLISYYPIKDSSGTVRAVSAVVQDITTRKQTENALRESERTLTTLFGNLPGMAYRCLNDPEWTMTFVSGGCFDLTGYQPADLLHGRRITFSELIHPDDRDLVWENVQQALTKKIAFRLVYRIHTAKNEEKWVWEQGIGVFSPNGELMALEGFITDITERKLAEQALQRAHDEQEAKVAQRTAAMTIANENLLQEIAVRERAEQALRRTQFAMEHASDAIFWLHNDGQFFDVNDAACKSVHYSVDELCQLHVWDIDVEFTAQSWSEKWLIFKQQISVTFESRHRKKNGVMFPVEITANYLEFENTEFMCVFVRDISERTQTQRALRESEAVLQAVLDNTQAIIYLKDAEGQHILVNRRFEELFNFSHGQVIGKTAHDLFPKETADVLEANDRKVFASKSRVEFEESVPQKDGIHRYLSLKFPLFDDAGEVYAACGISVDITSRKQAAEELQRAKETAETANRAKSVFLANMSHEIRTPITALLAAAELLPQCSNNKILHSERIDIILRNGRHLLALIDDLLEQSRLEAGTLKVAKRPCSLPDLLADIQAVVSPLRHQSDVEFTVQCTTRIPSMIHTDPTRFRQAIINLCDNAFKHTPKGFVRVTIGTSLKQGRVILSIEVADSGRGIPPSDQNRIFEQFAQVEEGQVEGTRGVGLGLSIVKWIADQLSGHIAVKSELGVGSVFTFQLDVGTPNEMAWLMPDQVLGNKLLAAGSMPLDLSSIRIHGMILLADDYEDSRNLIAAALTASGATVISVADGQEAIDAAKRDSFDLILMDVRMPNVDGITATQQIRKLGCLAPIIALTASTLGDRQDKILHAGFDDFWPKPMPIDTLLAAASAYLPVNQVEYTDASPSDIHSQKHAQVTASTKDKLLKVRQAFTATINLKVKAIADAIKSHNIDTAKEQLHQLVGAAGLHGHDLLTELAAELLAQLKRDPDTMPESLLEKFKLEASKASSTDG